MSPKRWECGPLAIVTALICLSAGNAQVQDDDPYTELRRCAILTNANQRLACYDGVLIPAAAESAGVEVDQVPAAVEPVAPVAPAVEPTPSPNAPPRAQPEPDPAPAIAAVPPNPAASTDDASEFGLRAERVEPDEITVTVVEVSQDLLGKHIFKTEDGQIWMQTDNRKVRFRDMPFDARIRGGSMGSYFLQSVGGGAALRVKRAR